ncbi:MAG TPA: amino acid permease, partial [Permianibacter sp.]|nr:amino acid permease [Permianibacter sp.]
FESGAINAGEGKAPARDIPRALIRTVLLTALLYFWMQWLAVSVLPTLASSAQPVAEVAAIVLGPWGAGLIAFAAVVSIIGNLSSIMMAAPRMSYALARDGCLPTWFAVIHPRFATPAASVAVVGGVSLLLGLSNSFVYLAVMSTLVRLIGYGLCAASVLVLERRQQRLAITGWLSPVVALALCAVLMSFASASAWLMLSVFVVVGSGFYVWARRGG